ncbi:MAG: hypothetical protein PVI75_02995 [Gammaproteobacteria bacterium]
MIKKNSPLISQDFVKNPGLYVVISQSCNMLHDSLEDEPDIELLYLEKIDSIDGNYQYGKNPRKIHICIKHGKNKECYLCHIKNRIFIQRTILQDITPSKEYVVEKKVIDSLVNWIIKRYNRAAFPDAFNERLRKSKKSIKDILEKNVDNVHGIFIQLEPEIELDDDKNYEITLRLIFPSHIVTNEERKNLDNVLENIVDILSQNKGILVKDDYRAVSVNDISYGEMSAFDNWDYDHLSYK